MFGYLRDRFGGLARGKARRTDIRPSEEERRAAISRICSREVDIGTWEDVEPLIGRFVEGSGADVAELPRGGG